jgi:hypothetical protein
MFSVHLVAPRSFKNAYNICEGGEKHKKTSHCARTRDVANKAIELLQEFCILLTDTHFFCSTEIDGCKDVHEFNRKDGIERIELLYYRACKEMESLNKMCRLWENARKVLDKPNMHRLLELYSHTILVFGHVHRVKELFLETSHRPFKRDMQKSNHQDEQVFAMGAVLTSYWESRLAL